MNVCPVGLMPLTLYALARKGFYDRARDAQHLMDCIECGACAYQCPARLPLVQYIRAAKGALRRARRRADGESLPSAGMGIHRRRENRMEEMASASAPRPRRTSTPDAPCRA